MMQMNPLFNPDEEKARDEENDVLFLRVEHSAERLASRDSLTVEVTLTRKVYVLPDFTRAKGVWLLACLDVGESMEAPYRGQGGVSRMRHSRQFVESLVSQAGAWARQHAAPVFITVLTSSTSGDNVAVPLADLGNKADAALVMEKVRHLSPEANTHMHAALRSAADVVAGVAGDQSLSKQLEQVEAAELIVLTDGESNARDGRAGEDEARAAMDVLAKNVPLDRGGFVPLTSHFYSVTDGHDLDALSGALAVEYEGNVLDEGGDDTERIFSRLVPSGNDFSYAKTLSVGVVNERDCMSHWRSREVTKAAQSRLKTVTLHMDRRINVQRKYTVTFALGDLPDNIDGKRYHVADVKVKLARNDTTHVNELSVPIEVRRVGLQDGEAAGEGASAKDGRGLSAADRRSLGPDAVQLTKMREEAAVELDVVMGILRDGDVLDRGVQDGVAASPRDGVLAFREELREQIAAAESVEAGILLVAGDARVKNARSAEAVAALVYEEPFQEALLELLAGAGSTPLADTLCNAYVEFMMEPYMEAKEALDMQIHLLTRKAVASNRGSTLSTHTAAAIDVLREVSKYLANLYRLEVVKSKLRRGSLQWKAETKLRKALKTLEAKMPRRMHKHPASGELVRSRERLHIKHLLNKVARSIEDGVLDPEVAQLFTDLAPGSSITWERLAKTARLPRRSVAEMTSPVVKRLKNITSRGRGTVTANDPNTRRRVRVKEVSAILTGPPSDSP